MYSPSLQPYVSFHVFGLTVLLDHETIKQCYAVLVCDLDLWTSTAIVNFSRGRAAGPKESEYLFFRTAMLNEAAAVGKTAANCTLSYCALPGISSVGARKRKRAGGSGARLVPSLLSAV